MKKQFSPKHLHAHTSQIPLKSQFGFIDIIPTIATTALHKNGHEAHVGCSDTVNGKKNKNIP